MENRGFFIFLLTLCSCGGGSSSDSTFTPGFYSGTPVSTTKSGLCKFVSEYSSYSVLVTELSSSDAASSLEIKRVIATSHGIFDAGVIPVVVSANANEVSFSDFDSTQESPTVIFGDDGTGTSFELSCFTKSGDVLLSARDADIYFEGRARIDCVNKATGEPLRCDIKEQGMLSNPAR